MSKIFLLVVTILAPIASTAQSSGPAISDAECLESITDPEVFLDTASGMRGVEEGEPPARAQQLLKLGTTLAWYSTLVRVAKMTIGTDRAREADREARFTYVHVNAVVESTRDLIPRNERGAAAVALNAAETIVGLYAETCEFEFGR